jgi:hypothetical protein
MITFNVGEATCGQQMHRYAEIVLAKAEQTRKTAMGLFNELPMIAFPGDKQAEVEARWRQLNEQHRTSYHRTPEYSQFMAMNESKAAKAISFMEEMRRANLQDLKTVIGLLSRSGIIGYTGTYQHTSEFVRMLKEAGYEENVNCGENFKADDKENVARWIVGQAMTMPGSGIEERFCKDWLHRWG